MEVGLKGSHAVGQIRDSAYFDSLATGTVLRQTTTGKITEV